MRSQYRPLWLAVFLAHHLLAFGWGAGHDTIARTVADRLPEPWRGRLHGEALVQFCSNSHYPDNFEAFPLALVGAEALDTLKAQGIVKRYDLHSDKGRAVAFCLLVNALKEEQPDRALLWLACLAHSTADMAACNHDPVVHIATYGWCAKEWGIKLPNGKPLSEIIWCLDLGWVQDASFGRRVDEELLRDAGSDASSVLLEIMLYGVRGAEACAPHGPLVLSAAAELAEAGKPEAGERLKTELSVLGSWATGRILRDFHAALRLARAGQVPEMTPELLARYEAEMDTFVKTRKLTSERFAQSALGPSGVRGPRIGVLIEPCWRMNEGMFGFGDRVLAVQIVNTLRRQGTNAELVDVRTYMETGADVLALIVPAQRYASYRTMKTEALDKQLTAYLGAGGKVVWIGGGKPPAVLCQGMPKELLVKGENKNWPETLASFGEGELVVCGDKGKTFPCQRLPEGKAGWQWPTNPYVFGAGTETSGVAFAMWRKGEQKEVIGLAWPKGKPSMAYVPGYAVVPYIWTKETPSLSSLLLELDAAGANVLETALNVLNRYSID